MLETPLHVIFRDQITTGSLRVTYPSGRRETYGDGTGTPLSLRIADPGALRAILLDPSLAVPEMYMDGRLVIEEGDVYELIALAKTNTRPEVSTPGAKIFHVGRSVTHAPVLRAVGLKAARANVAHHYDLDERLYRLFLDGDMQYSCAFFERPDMTLDQAQLAKKRLIAAKLLIRPGARVLDIGCGWGGMALYLARVCGADVTGITLSQEQHRVATERAAAAGLADRVRFRLQDYREVEGQFDNIVSVGMFEHVGLPQFPTFFRTVRRLLAPDGVMLLHAMSQPDGRALQPALHRQVHLPRRLHPRALGGLPRRREGRPPRPRHRDPLAALRRDHPGMAPPLPRQPRRRCSTSTTSASSACGSSTSPAPRAPSATTHIHVFHLQLALDQARVPLTRAYIPEAMARLAEAELDYPRVRRPARRAPGRDRPPHRLLRLSAPRRRGRRRPRARW